MIMECISGRMRDVALQLAPEEPEAGPWRAEPLRMVIEALTERVQAGLSLAIRSSWR